MRIKIALLTVLLGLSFATGQEASAAADSSNGYDQEFEKRHYYQVAKNKFKLMLPGSKYQYKENKNGVKMKFNGYGGPPPWAPAHGYRHKYATGPAGYVPPFGIGSGNCNRELLGSLLGAAAGGLAGSQIGDGRGQLAAVAGGTLLGFLIGGTIGRNMDKVDQNCVGQVLEHAGDGQQIAWNNPQTGAQYQVVPTRTVQGSDGRYCREYTATSVVSGRNQQTYGRACRQPDGSWKLVD
jgi:surface antigen